VSSRHALKQPTRPASRRALAEQFSPIETETAVDAVVDQIIDRIRSAELADGSVLPGERQLANAMGVSRRTIRSAIEVLQDAGVVEVSPGPAGGTRVASIWIPRSLWRERDYTTADELFQVLEARRVIEPRAAPLAALRGTDEDFQIMRRSIDLQSANQHDPLKLHQGNFRFHRQLWRAARNAELESAMRSIYRRLAAAFFTALEQDESSAITDAAIALHYETLEAVMSGRPDRTEAAMDHHLAYLERRCEIAYGRARVPQIPAFLIASTGDDAD
jgi:DNA-binding FadR family transcriptional regulator